MSDKEETYQFLIFDKAESVEKPSEEQLYEIIDLDKVDFPWPWDEKTWKSFLIGPRNYSLVLIYEGLNKERLVGFSLFELNFIEKQAHLYKIVICRELRGRGAALSLFSFHRKHLTDLGLESLYLEVAATNASAIAFYNKCGLEVIHKKNKFYGSGDDALIMTGSI